MLPERAITPSLINFDAVIRHLWAGAVTSVKWDHEHYDGKALDALRKDNDPIDGTPFAVGFKHIVFSESVELQLRRIR